MKHVLVALCVVGSMTGAAHAQLQTGPLDLTGRTLTDLAAQVKQGHLSSVQITQWYLDRIAALDRQGPKLQAVIALNPHALADAAALDKARAAGHAAGPLDGMPVLIKDNIETKEPIPTTAGGGYSRQDQFERVGELPRVAGNFGLERGGRPDAQSVRAGPHGVRQQQRQRGGGGGQPGGGRRRVGDGRVGDVPGQYQWGGWVQADAWAGFPHAYRADFA